MSPLEIALVVLVSIWSAIFLVIAIAVIIMVREIKKGLEKLNKILDQAENVAEGFGTVGKMAGAGLSGLLMKAGVEAFKKAVGRATGSKKKNNKNDR